MKNYQGKHMQKIKKIERDYHCLFCDRRWSQRVGKYSNVDGSKQNVSDQVHCVCGNFVRTWEN